MSESLKPGDRVRILRDTDGPNGRIGIVRTVYRSGRCCVDLLEGGFRNFAANDLKREEPNECQE